MAQKSVQEEGSALRKHDKATLPKRFSGAVWTVWFVLLLFGIAIELVGRDYGGEPATAGAPAEAVAGAGSTAPAPAVAPIRLGEAVRVTIPGPPRPFIGEEKEMLIGQQMVVTVPYSIRGRDPDYVLCTVVIGPRRFVGIPARTIAGAGTQQHTRVFEYELAEVDPRQRVRVRFQLQLQSDTDRAGNKCLNHALANQ